LRSMAAALTSSRGETPAREQIRRRDTARVVSADAQGRGDAARTRNW